MKYPKDIKDMRQILQEIGFNDISDMFNGDDDVQNTELVELDEDLYAKNRCPICDRQLVKDTEGWDTCDWCGFQEKV